MQQEITQDESPSSSDKVFVLKHLEQVDPRQLTEQDARRLIELCNLTYTGVTAKEVIQFAARGVVQIWRASGGPDGLLVTEVLRHNSGKELNVWGLIGSGLFRYFKGIRADLIEIAKQAGVRWLTGYTNDDRLNRIYAKVAGKGAEPYYRYQYLEDLES